MRRFMLAVGLATHLDIFIAWLVLGSFFLGLCLDRRFGSAPCFIVASVVFGSALAMFGTYRLATRLSK